MQKQSECLSPVQGRCFPTLSHIRVILGTHESKSRHTHHWGSGLAAEAEHASVDGNSKDFFQHMARNMKVDPLSSTLRSMVALWLVPAALTATQESSIERISV